MDLLYRVLGMAASANQALSRFRINFIPLNLIVVGGAATFFVMGAVQWEEAARNGSSPRQIDVASLSGSVPEGTFVRVGGLLAAEAGFTYGEQDDKGQLKKAEMEFVPLVDTGTGRGVFVQSAPNRFGKKFANTQVTGMVRPMQEFLSRELRPKGFKYAGVQMVPAYVLVADQKPGDIGTARITVAITGVFLLIFLTLTIKGNVIFRPAAMLSDVSLPSTGENVMFATGRFHLDKHRRRFIRMPTVLGTLDTGDLAAFANVDASSNFMGVTYAKRAGIWMMPMARGSMESIEEGTLYFGRKALPSVRFRYREADTQKTRTAILSLSGGSSRTLLGTLTGAASATPPRPVAAEVAASA